MTFHKRVERYFDPGLERGTEGCCGGGNYGRRYRFHVWCLRCGDAEDVVVVVEAARGAVAVGYCLPSSLSAASNSNVVRALSSCADVCGCTDIGVTPYKERIVGQSIAVLLLNHPYRHVPSISVNPQQQTQPNAGRQLFGTNQTHYNLSSRSLTINLELRYTICLIS